MPEKELKKHFGFDTFKKGQKEVISKILDGQSAAAIFPTGAGKSLCYQLPAMLLPAMTLVVSPLLSLMKDQLDFLTARGIPAARLDSTLDRDETRRIFDAARKGELKILMISVERFKNERFRHHLKNMAVSLLVIDEAHCISEWGHNFRPEYLNLPFYRDEFAIPQALLLTATASPAVIADMSEKFGISRENVVVTGFYRKNLFLKITPAPEKNKKALLLERLRKDPAAPTIVYVTLQKTAEAVAAFLCENHINAHAYHAGMENRERETIQNRFMDGTLACIAATIAFGMGIDKSDIRRVIHYDLPKSIENYSQEIGRAGRDDMPALCEVFASRDGIPVLENFIYGDTPDKTAVYQVLREIQQNQGFVWEFKLNRLSSGTNIRLLPLKTLLVYLAMEGVIRPKMTYFDQYVFKFADRGKDIIERFTGERKTFVAAVFSGCETKQIWTTVDFAAIASAYKTDRQRIVTALEYFDEKGWIALQARQAVEVYDIMTQAFDINTLTKKLHALFVKKEAHGIQRIHQMIGFFESRACISRELAAYFGEILTEDTCGHCSFCQNEKIEFAPPAPRPPLSAQKIDPWIAEFVKTAGDHATESNLTRFLCGIFSPTFTRFKAKTLPGFGALENYPFADVEKWVQARQKISRPKTSVA